MSDWPELKKFQTEFRAFVADREWEQFHTPKNLAMALSGDVGELLEHFQLLTPEQSANLPDETLTEVAQEIADVQIYLTALADRLGVEIGPSVARKMELNAEKYPAERVPVSPGHYTTYQKPKKRRSVQPYLPADGHDRHNPMGNA